MIKTRLRIFGYHKVAQIGKISPQLFDQQACNFYSCWGFARIWLLFIHFCPCRGDRLCWRWRRRWLLRLGCSLDSKRCYGPRRLWRPRFSEPGGHKPRAGSEHGNSRKPAPNPSRRQKVHFETRLNSELSQSLPHRARVSSHCRQPEVTEVLALLLRATTHRLSAACESCV